MEIVSYPAIFTPKDNEIQVDFPDLPEAFTQGKTMDEAMDFAKLVQKLLHQTDGKIGCSKTKISRTPT